MGKARKVWVEGEGEVRLGERDFVAAGGEGEIYARGAVAYKVYHDAGRMIPEGKIRDLAAILDPRVIKPERIVRDDKGNSIGYTMRFVKDTLPLPRLFPMAYRERAGVAHDQTLALVRRLQSAVSAVHVAGARVVDFNELNFLVAPDHSDLYLIDADSWQTPHFPPTAITEAVRDPLAWNGPFTTDSDWYCFAVLSFQLFVGIHPFKGKHPALKSVEERMRANISVLDPDVSVPRAVYPFSVIPTPWLDWYERLFQRGERGAPPSSPVAVVMAFSPAARVLVAGGAIELIELVELPSRVFHYWESGGSTIAVCEDGVYLDRRRVRDRPGPQCGLGKTRRLGRPVLAWQRGESLEMFDLVERRPIELALRVEQSMTTGGRIYAKSGEQIFEIELHEAGPRTIASANPAANCMQSATRLFEGVAVQNMLGAVYCTLFPRSGASHSIRTKELDGFTLVEARAQQNVLMVIRAHRDSGRLDRLVFRFAPDYTGYDLRIIEDVPAAGINFVALQNGVVACLTEDEELELSSAQRGVTGAKVVKDGALGGDLPLAEAGGRVVFQRGSRVFRLATK